MPSPTAKPPLVARADGGNSALRFKVLQLADLHYSGDPNWPCKDTPWALEGPCNEARMTAFVNELLDLETPDLVVFSGDNVQTFEPAARQRAVDAFTRGVEARGIPHAEILGNHDDDYGFAREDVLALGMAKRFSYTQRGPTYEADGVDGVGNYQLSVLAPASGPWGPQGASVFHMYFLDSGGRVDRARYPDATSRYDWIHDSQVQLYQSLSRANRAGRPEAAVPLPAIMFFHIPLREYLHASVEYWRRTGAMNEKVEPSDVHSGLFDALVAAGEVKATFAGHDHTNAYCYLRRGVQLCTSCGAGLGVAYSDPEYTRRARVIEWSVNSANERTLTSWKRLVGGASGAAGRFETEVLYTEDRGRRVGLVEPPASSHVLVVVLHLCAVVVFVLMLVALA
ncbi:hypothetical protein PybrP1_002947, partial [[Pythium] brassicae (nom. inval.)]